MWVVGTLERGGLEAPGPCGTGLSVEGDEWGRRAKATPSLRQGASRERDSHLYHGGLAARAVKALAAAGFLEAASR
jgi:hypothetical protein